MQRQLRSGLPMAALRNAEIADLFDLLGDLYELDGVNMFRVQAYHRAATQMRTTAESVWQLSEDVHALAAVRDAQQPAT